MKHLRNANGRSTRVRASQDAGTPSGNGRRGKPPALTEEEIVEAALTVIRSEGVDALSMRRLSRELGRSAMAAYWYVDDKQQLLDLVARKLLSEVPLPDPAADSWETRLREVIAAIHDKLRQYPGMAEILLQRMLSTDRRLMNGMMEILISAGFSGADVFLAYAMIHTYLFGRYEVAMHPEQIDPLPAELEDTLARLAPDLRRLRGRDFFQFGVDTIIAGLRARLDATSRPARQRKN